MQGLDEDKKLVYVRAILAKSDIDPNLFDVAATAGPMLLPGNRSGI